MYDRNIVTQKLTRSPSYIGIKNVETARTDNEEAGKINV
jgi:hypothetical protein